VLARNPIALAQAWQCLLASRECPSQADRARTLGVSRARVTQILGLLELAPGVVTTLTELGAPLPGPLISERRLRPLLKLPVEEQPPALHTRTSHSTRHGSTVAVLVDLWP